MFVLFIYSIVNWLNIWHFHSSFASHTAHLLTNFQNLSINGSMESIQKLYDNKDLIWIQPDSEAGPLPIKLKEQQIWSFSCSMEILQQLISISYIDHFQATFMFRSWETTKCYFFEHSVIFTQCKTLLMFLEMKISVDVITQLPQSLPLHLDGRTRKFHANCF